MCILGIHGKFLVFLVKLVFSSKTKYQHVSIYLHAGTKLFPGENSATDLGLTVLIKNVSVGGKIRVL
jgi:hypothetical protein